jgi:serine protease Do
MVSLASEDIPSLVKQAMPGVVLIKTYDSNGNELSQGSGFVISKEGDVITCYHVMKGYSKATVNTSDGMEFQVSNVTALRKSDDLARISLATGNYTFANLNLNITIPEAGQEIIVIGGPLGLEKTVSQGTVSAIRNNTIQITAPISSGSSGGPVFNMNGEVIGIVSSQMNKGQNLNFAIPACLISTMQPASAEQINELRSTEESYSLSEEEIHKTITSAL